MTEQQEISQFANKFWKWWLLSLVFGLILGSFLSKNIKPSYEGAVSFSLNRNAETTPASADYYRYDNYYAEQAAVMARNNLAGWLHAPKTVYDIYVAAGLPAPDARSPMSLSKSFTTSELIASNVDVSYKTGKQEETERLGKALVDYTQKNFPITGYTLKASDPLTTMVQPSTKIVVLGSGLALLLLSFLWSLLAHYFSPSK